MRIALLVLLTASPMTEIVSSVVAADTPTRRFIAADSSKKRIAIIGEDGRIEWERKIGPLHDLHVLP
ncbi:MAG: hypothetical protein ABGZ53_38000, partial [Fuerstiella sp.]